MIQRRYQVFAHLNADKSSLYRAALEAFGRARDSFRLHLRPGDLASELALPEDDVAPLLGQLTEWGNLLSLVDMADAATVEEFYRPKFLYQLSPEGEAAERALAFYQETLVQPGELQATALADILDQLRNVRHLLSHQDPDAGKIHLALTALKERFEQLTQRAQSFMSSVQRNIDLYGLSLESLLDYKSLLMDYIERFVAQLVATSAEIAQELLDMAPQQELLTELAARREAADALDAADANRRARELWTQRWTGLTAWFLGTPGRRSQAEELRARALNAITVLLAAITTMNDRRANRSDRRADFCTLARWFAQAEAPEAHRLWRAAFSLSPARHLYLDRQSQLEREAQPVSPQTSWLQAPPQQLAIRFRKTGSYTRRGRTNDVVDRSDHKRLLEAVVREENALLQKARERLATGQRVRLSDLPELDLHELTMLLDLLGDALAEQGEPGVPVEAWSSDGSLRILLEPTEGEGSLRSVLGTLSGREHFLTLETAT